MERTRTYMEKVKKKGSQRLLACFDLYQDWFSKPHFAGCIFVKTLNEFQECSERLFALAVHAKSELRDYLVEIAKEEGARDPECLADQLQLILEGSIVVAQCGGRGRKIIHTARKLAAKTISEALSLQCI